MARRRMLSLDIVDSEQFTDMPCSARLLYYDLAVRADESGFMRCPRAISHATGASLGDLECLLLKGFAWYEDSKLFIRR